MTANPWPSVVWTAVLIGLFAFLAVIGQHISDRRAAKRIQVAHDAHVRSLDRVLDIDAGLDDVLNQRKGEQ